MKAITPMSRHHFVIEELAFIGAEARVTDWPEEDGLIITVFTDHPAMHEEIEGTIFRLAEAFDWRADWAEGRGGFRMALRPRE
jgi:hypothetical protein